MTKRMLWLKFIFISVRTALISVVATSYVESLVSSASQKNGGLSTLEVMMTATICMMLYLFGMRWGDRSFKKLFDTSFEKAIERLRREEAARSNKQGEP